jgi:antitoxin component of MazEF toxin-antitoxin module
VFTTFGFLRMTTTVKSESELVVPASVERQASIKQGDRVNFEVSHRTITIRAVSSPTYKPTKAELAAIRCNISSNSCRVK